LATPKPSAWAGRPLRRIEDDRLLCGQGNYIEDIPCARMAHISLVRSPFAHARIRDVDLAAARAAPGVVAVVTADDLPSLASIPAVLPGGRPVPEHPALARGIARFTGEPVVAVVAEQPQLALDAASAVVVDYDPLPAVVDGPAALEASAPRVHDSLGNNEAFRVALLEASADDLILQDGAVSVRGVPDRSASLGEIVVSLGNGPLTNQTSFSSQNGDTFPFGSTVAWCRLIVRLAAFESNSSLPSTIVAKSSIRSLSKANYMAALLRELARRCSSKSVMTPMER